MDHNVIMFTVLWGEQNINTFVCLLSSRLISNERLLFSIKIYTVFCRVILTVLPYPECDALKEELFLKLKENTIFRVVTVKLKKKKTNNLRNHPRVLHVYVCMCADQVLLFRNYVHAPKNIFDEWNRWKPTLKNELLIKATKGI